MKIGIYGDSFGESYIQSKHFAWYNLLTRYLPGSKVKSFAKGGTSVFYSYKQFLQTHHMFDVIIFLVTEPNRYTKPVNINGEEVYPHNIIQIDKMLSDKNISNQDKNFLVGLKNYYVDIIDEDFNAFATELMLEKIEKMHHRIIFFPCFYNSFSQERANKEGISLTSATMAHFSQRQSNALRIDNIGFYEENTGTISCHFTEEYNNVISEVFAQKIKDDTWNFNKITSLKIKHNNKLHFYNKRFDLR